MDFRTRITGMGWDGLALAKTTLILSKSLASGKANPLYPKLRWKNIGKNIEKTGCPLGLVWPLVIKYLASEEFVTINSALSKTRQVCALKKQTLKNRQSEKVAQPRTYLSSEVGHSSKPAPPPRLPPGGGAGLWCATFSG